MCVGVQAWRGGEGRILALFSAWIVSGVLLKSFLPAALCLQSSSREGSGEKRINPSRRGDKIHFSLQQFQGGERREKDFRSVSACLNSSKHGAKFLFSLDSRQGAKFLFLFCLQLCACSCQNPSRNEAESVSRKLF